MALRPGCMVRTIRTICGQLRTWAEIGAHLRKNRLKRLKIKRGTTSKVNYILFNRLLSMVPLNKSGLVRAKPGNFILKSLNRCFSNYYQVRTWRVFAEMVTYVFIVSIILVMCTTKVKVKKMEKFMDPGYITKYRISGNIDSDFNLAIWLIALQSSN